MKTKIKTGRKAQYPTLFDRVMANTTILPWSGCWVWEGSVQHQGYGVITVYRGNRVTRGILGLSRRSRYLMSLAVHRIMYQIIYNKLLDTRTVLRHKCNVRTCWNPDHLQEGTQKENIMDQLEAGTNINYTGKTRWARNKQRVQELLERGY